MGFLTKLIKRPITLVVVGGFGAFLISYPAYSAIKNTETIKHWIACRWRKGK